MPLAEDQLHEHRPGHGIGPVWGDAGKAELAANALKLTSQDLLRLGLIDDIIPEPPGGAHEDSATAAEFIRVTLSAALAQTKSMSSAQLIDERYVKFRKMGNFFKDEV